MSQTTKEGFKSMSSEQLEMFVQETTKRLMKDKYYMGLRPAFAEYKLDALLSNIAEYVLEAQAELDTRKKNS